ncbi:group 3 secretory phospholipase A2-like, partial [Silurus meridionalis]
FCFHVKSELGRTQCSFLRRPSAEASVLFYWSIWTADDRVEECSISAEPAVLHNYRSVCNEQSMWDLHKTSPRNINITALFEPDSPCELQSVGRWNLRPQKYLDTAQKKRQKRAWIFPGTLWCGHGSRAGEYEQLGMFERVDRCCREHDHCDHTIRPFTVNFGVFNPTLFTISHCECDRRFKQCLVDINDTVSNMVGYTFFNILNQQCFELIQKRRCTKINWIGMCTTDTVAPFAVLKHTMTYNAT